MAKTRFSMTPDQIARHLQAAVAHHRAGRLEDARALYDRIRATQPKHFDATHLAGTVAYQQGRASDAVTLLTRALRIDPKSPVCQLRLGLAHLANGEIATAEHHVRAVLARQPQFHEAWDNLGMILKSAGRLDEALAAHRRSIELQPRYAPGWYNLGMTHALLGHAAAALACHDHALVADPAHPLARYGRAQALQHLHRIDEALAAYDDQLTRFPSHHEARSARLLALNYRDRLSREALFAEHLAYGEHLAGSLSPSPEPTAKARPAGPLRVGFYSPDFRTHAVANFIEPLLRHLDPRAFTIVLYHDHFVVDATSARLQAHAQGWRNLIGQPLEVAAAQIRTDALDVLVDLAGHTGFSRLALFAQRLAPVQIGYLGYPNTSGLRTMDWKFTDALADLPGESDTFHTERLCRFSDTAWAYQPPADAGPVAPLPCAKNPGITFGSFNNFAKISDPLARLWARVLAAVPNSRLALKSSTTTDLAFLPRLARLGIDPTRVDLLPSAPSLAAHLDAYRQVDIALDTHPYHGTTTTCEALWMGRPVVTLEGHRHASRVGCSLLTAIGHPEWIARTEDLYVQTCLDLAADRGRLRALSDGLRADLQASPLLDHPAQARRFGEALLECWRQRDAARPSDHRAWEPALA